MAGDTVIKVMTSNALRTVFADLLPAFEQAHNIKVDASYDPAKRVQKRLAAGETADVAVSNLPAIERMIGENILDVATRREFAHYGIGIAVKAGVKLFAEVFPTRIERGAGLPHVERIAYLAELAGEALADLWPQAQARHVTLALEAEQPVPMHGDRAALSALVRNLADNALRYEAGITMINHQIRGLLAAIQNGQ